MDRVDLETGVSRELARIASEQGLLGFCSYEGKVRGFFGESIIRKGDPTGRAAARAHVMTLTKDLSLQQFSQVARFLDGDDRDPPKLSVAVRDALYDLADSLASAPQLKQESAAAVKAYIRKVRKTLPCTPARRKMERSIGTHMMFMSPIIGGLSYVAGLALLGAAQWMASLAISIPIISLLIVGGYEFVRSIWGRSIMSSRSWTGLAVLAMTLSAVLPVHLVVLEESPDVSIVTTILIVGNIVGAVLVGWMVWLAACLGVKYPFKLRFIQI